MESFVEFLFNKKSKKEIENKEEVKSNEEIHFEDENPIVNNKSNIVENHKIEEIQLLNEEIKEIENTPLEQTQNFLSEKIEENYKEELELELDETYKIYRDKSEIFLCDMEITGASPETSKARIIIESKDLTYMFEGTIDPKGRCRIPLKKMNFLQENEKGVIKLEVIAEDMLFVPWTEEFTAVSSKKVKIKNITESQNTAANIGIKITRINK